MKTALPTIGIRPTIDGRRLGVRESLEDQTMNMAKAAAALIEANIRHASGEPVKCVIADTCIGGPAEAAACATIKANNVGVSPGRYAPAGATAVKHLTWIRSLPRPSGASTARNAPVPCIWPLRWPA